MPSSGDEADRDLDRLAIAMVLARRWPGQVQARSRAGLTGTGGQQSAAELPFPDEASALP